MEAFDLGPQYHISRDGTVYAQIHGGKNFTPEEIWEVAHVLDDIFGVTTGVISVQGRGHADGIPEPS